MIVKDNLKIYCTYHDKELISKYNLKETENFKLFYTKDNLPNYSLNYAQLYFNEFVTQYYIWKNQIKSDIIGFCHYGRVFTNIDYDKINNNYIQAYEIYYTIADNLYHDLNYCGLGYYIDLLIDYVNKYYNKYNIKLIDVLFTNNKYNNKLIRECYICKWEIFNDMMQFIYNFLKIKIFNNIELNDITLIDYQNFIDKLSKIQWDYREIYFKTYNIPNTTEGCFGDRCIAFLIEQLINIYFQIIANKNILSNL